MRRILTGKGAVQLAAGLFIVLVVCGCAGLKRPSLNPSIPAEREKMVKAYLEEFSSPVFNGTKIGDAIYRVMMRLPPKALLTVMDRRRPVLFTEVYDVGTGRLANSAEIVVTPKDKPAFQEGMTIIKISTALNKGSVDAVMGVIAHELAHRVMDNVRRGHVNCQAEREANQLVKKWGFTKEFKQASDRFGEKREGEGVASCQES